MNVQKKNGPKKLEPFFLVSFSKKGSKSYLTTTTFFAATPLLVWMRKR